MASASSSINQDGVQSTESSDRRVFHADDIIVENFDNCNVVERNNNETTEQLLCRAFLICLKSYICPGCDYRSKGIVLVKKAFPENMVPSENEINSGLDDLWKIQKEIKRARRFILSESSRHRSMYRLDFPKERDREMNCIFAPMQDTVVKIIQGTLKLLNDKAFCRENFLDFYIRYIDAKKLPCQELITSLEVPEDEASATQTCHIDFPYLNAKGMSCFLSASNGTKLQVMYTPEATNRHEVASSNLNTSGAKFLSIEYDRTDFLIMRGDWPHRGTNYTR
jgi:hypothetical protein